MNKKILGIAIILLTVALVATPLMATVQAAKTIIPFDYTFNATPPPEVPGEVKYSGDDHLRISKGTQRNSTYSGPLGVGWTYTEGIISITDFDNETVGFTTFHGHGNYRALLNINSGPYGKGTLEGIMILEFDYNISRPIGYRYLIWGNTTYQHGTGDLKGIRMDQSVYWRYLTPILVRMRYWGEIILP